MRYGYARVPETLEVKHTELPVVNINLTPKGGVFKQTNEDDFIVDVEDNFEDGNDE